MLKAYLKGTLSFEIPEGDALDPTVDPARGSSFMDSVKAAEVLEVLATFGISFEVVEVEIE